MRLLWPPRAHADGFVPLLRADALRDGLRLRRRVGGVELLLLHEGDLTAVVENRCPHMGARLDRGEVEGTTLWCPKHGFSYDLVTGRRIAPASVLGGEESLVRHALIERDGWLGVKLPAP
jgi:nitrite reductase/ring-hydroxylating ferredoxin subunit